MKRFLAITLSVAMLFSTATFASSKSESEKAVSEQMQQEMATTLHEFEEEHPELKDQFHLVVKDVTDIASEEFREAFTRIQDRFAKMLEEDGKQLDIPEEAREAKRQTLQTQAALLNANFLVHLKVSEERLIASLRGMDYPEDETDVIATLKEISEGMEGNESVSNLKEGIDWILETAEKEYNNDLGAWYNEVSARPELPEGETEKIGDESRPPMPPEGEKPEGEEPEGDRPEPDQSGIPFNDHFKVICEELQAAIERIDEKMQALEQEAPEKYQIPEDVAAEEFGLLNELFVLVNNQMMEQLGNLEAHVLEPVIGAPDPSAENTEVAGMDDSEMDDSDWTLPDTIEMTSAVTELFNKGMEGLVGVNYEPLGYLGEKDGLYCILCRATVVYPGAVPYYALVYVNDDGIQNIWEIWMDKHANP